MGNAWTACKGGLGAQSTWRARFEHRRRFGKLRTYIGRQLASMVPATQNNFAVSACSYKLRASKAPARDLFAIVIEGTGQHSL
jgi:hypothetical protein